MTDLKIGQIIDATAKRDAIHIAIAPVIADEKLAPGQSVDLVPGSIDRVYATGIGSIGIIDPFLPGYVLPGQRCWLFLHPGMITSLRHEWTHPAFEETEND